jgi:lipoprotein
MKKIIVLLSILLISGCAMQRQRLVSTFFLDYRPYTEHGFFISPDPFNGKFIPVGDLAITVIPGTEPKKTQEKMSIDYERAYFDDIYATPSIPAKEIISPEELLEIAVSEAQKVGANGISNFKCECIRNIKTNMVESYYITGFCIRID